MVVSRSRTIAPGYGDLTLGGAELEEVKSLRILGVTLDSKLSNEIHLREVVSKATKCLGVVRRAGKLLIKLFTYAQELFQCICFVQLEALHPCVDVIGGGLLIWVY